MVVFISGEKKQLNLHVILYHLKPNLLPIRKDDRKVDWQINDFTIKISLSKQEVELSSELGSVINNHLNNIS